MVLPGLLGDGPGTLNEALMRDLDMLIEARDSDGPTPHVVECGSLGELVAHPPIVDKVTQIMEQYGNQRTDFALHHIHAVRQDAGTGPSNWHQVRSRPCICISLSSERSVVDCRITSRTRRSTART